MKKSDFKEVLPLLFGILLLFGTMLGARFLHGDFTKVTYAHAPIQTDLEQYVAEADGRALININRADEETLMMIHGIGEVLAERIIDYREENGAFESVEELLNVKGIGEKTLEKMKPRITCIPEEKTGGASLFGIFKELFD